MPLKTSDVLPVLCSVMFVGVGADAGQSRYTMYVFKNIVESTIGELMLKYVNMQAVRTIAGMTTTIIENLTPDQISDMGLGLHIGFCCRCCGNSAKRMQVCSGCMFTKYCSRECQKKDWKRHQGSCSLGFKDSKRQFPRPHDTFWGIISEYQANMVNHIAPMYNCDPITDIEFTHAVRI